MIPGTVPVSLYEEQATRVAQQEASAAHDGDRCRDFGAREQHGRAKRQRIGANRHRPNVKADRLKRWP